MNNLDLLERQSIDAAIKFNWPIAIKINQEIIKIDKKNINAYLRLGFAYIQSNQYSLSKESYQKALKLQPGNQIAKQNLDRLTILEKKGKRKDRKQEISLDPNLFIDIPGKTKSVVLVNLGQKDVIAQLFIGQEVIFKSKKRRIEIRTKNQEYLGCLPDDLSKRLTFFIEAQSKYRIYIKEANLNKVTIFIKEEKKGKKVIKFISFPPSFNSAGGEEIKGIPTEEELEKPAHEDEMPEHEIEKLAEEINEEEKIYLPYGPHEEEEEE